MSDKMETKLNRERYLAMEALKKSTASKKEFLPAPTADDFHSAKLTKLRYYREHPAENPTTPKTPADQKNKAKFDLSCLFGNKGNNTPGYELLNSPTNNTINISELESDQTIHLRPFQVVTFEPSEMTGRSTLNLNRKYGEPEKTPSVEEILASSCFEDVRNLSKSYRESMDGSSLPKTADLSQFSQDSILTEFLKGNGNLDISDNFRSAEDVSQNWENEFDMAPKKLNDVKCDIRSHFVNRISDGEISGFFGDGDVSEGGNRLNISEYINKKNDDIRTMIPNISPTKKGKPKSLIDQSDMSITPSEKPDEQQTDFIDLTEDKENSFHLSYISEAIKNMDISKNSPITLANKLMASKKAKKHEPLADITGQVLKETALLDMEMELKKFDERELNEKKGEKRGRSPNISTKISDTASFTDSLLEQSTFQSNSPAMNRKQISTNLSAPNVDDFHSERFPKSRFQEFKAVSDASKIDCLPVPTTKRTRSSTRIESDFSKEQLIRKSRSPSGNKEMKAVSGTIKSRARTPSKIPCKKVTEIFQFKSPKISSNKSNSTNELDRMYLTPMRSPSDHGKASLPSYCTISPTPNLTSNHRSPSQCSDSSEFSHQSGFLPIKSTNGLVSWGCVKLRKTVKKSIQIKNMSSKRLNCKVDIMGPGFQLTGPESCGTLTLQGLECRTIAFIFCPTVIGYAVGRFSMKSPHNSSGEHKNIDLFGYGGSASILLREIFKGLDGRTFLPLGDIRQLSQPIVKSFIIENKGTVPGFFIAKIDTKDVAGHSSLGSSLSVYPGKVIVKPGGFEKITINFRPRKNDIKKIVSQNTDVMIVANLTLITGDEPTRKRIKKIVEGSKNDFNMKDGPMIGLVDDIPRQDDSSDVEMLKESLEDMIELTSTLKTHELTLTVNRNLDDTVVDFSMLAETDESLLFKTLTSEHLLEEDLILVNPTNLVFSKSHQNCQVILIKSNSYKIQTFEFDCDSSFFTISPKEGQILPGEEIKIYVKNLKETVSVDHHANVMLLLENERITIPLVIKRDSYGYRK